jgi:putative flippase GtrA
MTGMTVKSRANSCGANVLRGMPECVRDATSRQAIEGERVALHRPDGKSLNAPTFVGAGSCNPCAGNDMRASAARATNSLSGKLLAANGLRGFGPRAGRENAAEIGKNSTRTSTLLRWGKFNLVGAVGILVQFGVLFWLKSVLHFNYLAATALAVEAAVVHNFFWHERFTWSDRSRSEWGRPSWGERASGAKARNLPNRLFAALKRCATQKRFSQECATQDCSTQTCSTQTCSAQTCSTQKCAAENFVAEARARPKSKAAGKSARSTQTDVHKLIQECASQKFSTQKLRSPRLNSLNLRGARFGRFLRFNLTTGLVSIGGNLGMMRVMVGRAHMNYLVANGIAIAVCSLVNFAVSDGWVFGENESDEQMALGGGEIDEPF